MKSEAQPLISHVLYRLDVGGLENGVVNLINRMPEYRHAILCMTDYTDFRRRIRHPECEVYALHKRPGQDIGVYVRLWRLLRRLRPNLIHTRNLSAMEALLPAWLAGVRRRVHGEHGRDVHDLDGNNRRYQWLRRLYQPLVHAYIPLSRDLEHYLLAKVGVPARKVKRIYNGVDSVHFSPASAGRAPLPVTGFAPPEAVVIGTVGRMQDVKDPLNLVRAFVHLLQSGPEYRTRLRLVMIGDGPLRAQAQAILAAADATELAWLPGARDDVADLMRALDVFALPSKAEGISNTILEAMACGLPVVATDVGGNAELVAEGITGTLVAANDAMALAAALRPYIDDPDMRHAQGAAGRSRIEREFSMDAMVQNYRAVYEGLLHSK